MTVHFEPPLFIQRRAHVLEILKELKPGVSSLLDVGCGDAGLLQYLQRCRDDLPIEKMTGVDIDDETLDSAVQNIQYGAATEASRWRPLQMEIQRGTYRAILRI